MDELGERIRDVLGDPEQMAQIMGLAQSLMGGGDAPEPPPPPSDAPDGALLGKLGALLSSDAGGGDQQALLQAMKPYLSEKRRRKMDRAIRITRAAHLARLALDGMGGREDA